MATKRLQFHRRPPRLAPDADARERRAAFESLGRGEPSDFGLAPITEFPRTLLTPQDGDVPLVKKMRRVTLLLALAFNDLKDLGWAQTLLLHLMGVRAPSVTPEYGQLAGMHEDFVRKMAGVIAELGTLILSEDKSEVFSSHEFQLALKMSGRPDCLAEWKELTSAFALAEKAPKGMPKLKREEKFATAIAKFIFLVRNRIAYHYAPHAGDEEQLGRGFDAFFAGPVSDANRAAMASLGQSNEASRFYFADAAAIRAFQDAREGAGLDSLQFRDMLRLVSVTLRHVVEGMRRFLLKHHPVQAS